MESLHCIWLQVTGVHETVRVAVPLGHLSGACQNGTAAGEDGRGRHQRSYDRWEHAPASGSWLRRDGNYIRVLVENGADVLARDSHGATLLHRAAFRRHVDTARMLVEEIWGPTSGHAT
jgi:hypothetical protein